MRAHPQIRLTALALLCAALATGCGSASYIVLTVDGELTIPDDVSALHLVASSGGADQPLADWQLQLVAGQRFPLDVSIEPNADTPAALEVVIEATLGDQVVATTGGAFAWAERETTRVTLPALYVLPPP